MKRRRTETRSARAIHKQLHARRWQMLVQLLSRVAGSGTNNDGNTAQKPCRSPAALLALPDDLTVCIVRQLASPDGAGPAANCAAAHVARLASTCTALRRLVCRGALTAYFVDLLVAGYTVQSDAAPLLQLQRQLCTTVDIMAVQSLSRAAVLHCGGKHCQRRTRGLLCEKQLLKGMPAGVRRTVCARMRTSVALTDDESVYLPSLSGACGEHVVFCSFDDVAECSRLHCMPICTHVREPRRWSALAPQRCVRHLVASRDGRYVCAILDEQSADTTAATVYVCHVFVWDTDRQCRHAVEPPVDAKETFAVSAWFSYTAKAVSLCVVFGSMDLQGYMLEFCMHATKCRPHRDVHEGSYACVRYSELCAEPRCAEVCFAARESATYASANDAGDKCVVAQTNERLAVYGYACKPVHIWPFAAAPRRVCSDTQVTGCALAPSGHQVCVTGCTGAWPSYTPSGDAPVSCRVEVYCMPRDGSFAPYLLCAYTNPNIPSLCHLPAPAAFFMQPTFSFCGSYVFLQEKHTTNGLTARWCRERVPVVALDITHSANTHTGSLALLDTEWCGPQHGLQVSSMDEECSSLRRMHMGEHASLLWVQRGLVAMVRCAENTDTVRQEGVLCV